MDKISNLRALATGPPKGWSAERRLDYVDWSRLVAVGLRGANAWLEAEFAAAQIVAHAAEPADT